MSRFTLGALATILMFSLVACTKEDPNPELRDPIFKDLEKRRDEHQKNANEAAATLKTLYEKLEKVEANSIEKKDIQKDIAKNKAKNLESDQWYRYYKIRAERRRITGRESYREAFAKGEEWPNPREYSDYQVNRRLVEASRNWNARVPKLADRTPVSVKAAESKPSKGSEGNADAPAAEH